MTERNEAVTQRTDPGQPEPQTATSDPSVEKVTEDFLLARYIDRLAPSNFTEEARSALLYEVKQYTEEICIGSESQRRGDRNAEKALQQHVTDAANTLRNKRENPLDIVADWCKWIGFLFVGLAIQQWHNIGNEKPIVYGSVRWLVFDVILAACLIVIGFAIDKPWRSLANWRKRR